MLRTLLAPTAMRALLLLISLARADWSVEHALRQHAADRADAPQDAKAVDAKGAAPSPPPRGLAELTTDPRCAATCDVRGNLGPCAAVLSAGTDWIKDRWQAASDMGGTAIKGAHFVKIDLGRDVEACSFRLDWETAYASDYKILADGADELFDGTRKAHQAWRTSTESGQSPGVKIKAPLHVVHDITLPRCAKLREVTLDILRPARGWGVSLWRVEVYGGEVT